jgi:catechol 2,3-dioxygenase-like lactoylglutathione lyase family enzyme
MRVAQASIDGKAPGVSLEVGLVVRDLDEVTPFYRDGLGLVHVRDVALPHGTQRRFACGGGVFKLLQPKVAPTGSNPPGHKDTATGLRWFSIRVSGIEQVIDRCLALGGRVVQPLGDWGTHMIVLVEDPAGSCWIELSEPKSDGPAT